MFAAADDAANEFNGRRARAPSTSFPNRRDRHRDLLIDKWVFVSSAAERLTHAGMVIIRRALHP